MFEVILPNGDCAEAQSIEGAMLAVETLLDDLVKFMRDNIVVKRDGEFDAAATAMASSAGMLV